MNCWHCNEQLIWGGDHDIEEENEDYTAQNSDEEEETPSKQTNVTDKKS